MAESLVGAYFQFSESLKLDRTVQERWITDPYFLSYSLIDSLGARSRVLRVTLSNPKNARSDSWYPPMVRVRLMEDFGVVAFLGRVVSVEPQYAANTVVLTCRDFLDDISDHTVEAAETDGVITGVTRNYLIDTILNNDTYKPTKGGDTERTLVRRLQMDNSSYCEQISRTYGQKGNFQTQYSSSGADFEYRGVKTGLEALSEISSEDAQQDLMAFLYHPVPTDPTSANHINDPQKYPRTYWTDLTRDIVDGSSFFYSNWIYQDSNDPETTDILYFGSNSKFDGLRFHYLVRGATIVSSNTTGTQQWQYWNGTAWTNFTPTADAEFSADTGKTYGTTYWNIANLTGWLKRDLGSSPDMPTGSTLNWPAPWTNSGTTLHDDVKSDGISKVDHGDNLRTTNRYWVRTYHRGPSTAVAKINTVDFYTKPTLFHDFRCEDPQFFDEVWKYQHNVTATGWPVGRDGPGGIWDSLNTIDGRTGVSDRLLWDSNDNVTPFLNRRNQTMYFGLDYPFNGVQFHARQINPPDYSNVDMVWQWFSNWHAYYYGSAHGWQTISGLTISGNTVANPTVITTERHHLNTGDTVTISGSNSTPTINGTHTITYISTTTFSIAVNVTTAGTAGHVICDDRITQSSKMMATGDASWMQDIGLNDDLEDYYIDVRWDTSNPEIFLSSFNDLGIDELRHRHVLEDYPYDDRASLKSFGNSKTSTDAVNMGINSISVANPTVITTAAGSGGSTTNHNLRTGDRIFIRGSDSTPSIDGFHVITNIVDGDGVITSFNTFTIDVNVTTAGDAGTVEATTFPPNDKNLYWVRCYYKLQNAADLYPKREADLMDVQTSPVGSLKYFSRGKEPWNTNSNLTAGGTVASRDVEYCYRYDTSASAGSKFTNYSEEIKSTTSGTSLQITGNTVANPTIVTTTGVALTISSNSVADETVITTSAVHGLSTGDLVVIASTNSTPTIDDTYSIVVLSTTTFSVEREVTSAGSAGTATPIVFHDLTTGHSVTITGSNSTPSLNGTHTVTVLSTTTFSIAVNVTVAGTAGTVVPAKVTAVDNGQIGDAIYFGMTEPFTVLRLNISDALSSSSSGYSAITWEFFRGESTDDWATISHLDYTGDFSTTGTNEVVFIKPFDWKTCQPGIKEANATDQSFGKTAYYIRARLGGNTGSPATSTAQIVQGLAGPRLWLPEMEVGTISGVTSNRFSTPLTYGLSLVEGENTTDQSQPVVSYSLREKPIDFVNKVVVRGQAGAYGTVQDDDLIASYGIINEKVIDDSSLTNSLQCETRASALLEQYKPVAGVTGTNSFRECRIRLSQPPVYSYLKRPQFLRAGDRVNVTLNSADIIQENWLVYTIQCTYSEESAWVCELLLFRDLTSVFETGSSESRIIRDLINRSRETANAVFQPMDKAVASGLDFVPEGPGRVVGREEFDSHGTELGIYNSGGSTSANWTGEFRWTRKLYSNHNTRETVSKDLLRVDLLGLNPDEDGVASGGAGLGFIARDKNGNGTPDFHPGTDEGTLYLRNSATNTEGSGLYLAHRDIFNSGATYDEWNTDTPKINAEVMTGFTGFVDHVTLDANGRFTINLPALDAAPLIFSSICGHEGLSGTPGNNYNATCNVYRWTTSGGKYTAVEMQVVVMPNGLDTDGGSYSITAISAANPTVITTTGSMPNGRAVWIGQSNSTPAIDGLYHVSNKAGSSPYTYTLTAVANSSFPVNVTSAGTSGYIMSMGHDHDYDQGAHYDYSDDSPAIGIMYMVVFNSGKNTTGLNSHFSQNHTNHG